MLILKSQTVLENPEYVEDSKRIRKLVAIKGGNITLVEAERIWQNYSNNMCAGWLTLPDDDEVLWNTVIKDYFYNVTEVE